MSDTTQTTTPVQTTPPTFPNRCNNCRNCHNLTRVQQRVLATCNPPFSHGNNDTITLWNRELADHPCTNIIPLEEMVDRYIERQDATAGEILSRLKAISVSYRAVGFMLLECQMMDSSMLGSLVILPFGGKSTFHVPPHHPVSPRGLASDTSTVVAVSLL